MGFPIPKGTGDKIISVLGLVVVILGLAASFAKGQGDVGIATTLGGAGMFAKGMEEFLTGNVSQGAADTVSSVETVKAAEPAAKAEATAIVANPTPIVEAAIPVVAEAVQAAIDKEKVA
jgi:L-asparagine transporter-like permease